MAGIEGLIDQLNRHQNDVEPFLSLHTDDAVIVNFVGRRVLGKPALRAAMEAALAGPLADVQTVVEVDDVRYVRPDVAIVSCTKTVVDGRVGQLTYVLVDDGDGWRVALAQTTPDASNARA